jgi:hypothetical protein
MDSVPSNLGHPFQSEAPHMRWRLA